MIRLPHKHFVSHHYEKKMLSKVVQCACWLVLQQRENGTHTIIILNFLGKSNVPYKNEIKKNMTHLYIIHFGKMRMGVLYSNQCILHYKVCEKREGETGRE